MHSEDDFLWGLVAPGNDPLVPAVSNNAGVDRSQLGNDCVSAAAWGAGAYRFSFSWPELKPSGHGSLTPAVLDHYHRKIDAILEGGLQPWVVLCDGEMPEALLRDGGWMNRETAYRFGEYVQQIAGHFADRVAAFVTLNEPYTVMHHRYGLMPRSPGHEVGLGAFAAGHHQLLAHGIAAQALRTLTSARVGVNNSYAPAWPAGDQPRDRIASLVVDAMHNQVFTKPLFGTGYPMLVIDLLRRLAPESLAVIRPDDLATIADSVDFLGVSYRQPDWVHADKELPSLPRIETPPGFRTTAAGYAMVPEGLIEVLEELHQHHREYPPLYVTLPACPVAAPPKTGDVGAGDYVNAHLTAIEQAVAHGVDVKGCFVGTGAAASLRQRISAPTTASA